MRGVLFHDQDYLVLSESAAKEVLAKPAEEQMAYLADCDVTYSEEEELWGIIRHQNTTILGEVTF